MKKAAIVLLALYFLGTTEAGQILKLPLLVEHYVKHKADDPNITIFSFLKMHYTGPVVYDADYAQDMQLPFKTCLNFFTITPPSILPVTPQYTFKVPVVRAPRRKIINDEVPPYLYQPDIFQPPQA
ncbi:hypothetical protein [Chitinophaga sp. 212800010-3]|uniref:hypothetical protein n=1 Tax=unclassified Chitinophaga TaxID=2619133 RepID=UPI002DE990A2|nr:hypothetical protein [Chitinophaga sp. 212800010-3]